MVLFIGTRRFSPNWDVETTELAAACYGLKLEKRYEVENIHLEGDSMSVMNAFAKKERGIAPTHAL